MSSRPRAFRWLDRLGTPIEIAGSATALGLLWYVTDIPAVSLAGVAFGFVLARLWNVLRRRYGLNAGWGKLPVGGALLALGALALSLPDGYLILKGGFVVAGLWVTLDGIYDLRSGAGSVATGTPNPMERFGDAAVVARSIDDEPRTIDELVTELDLSRVRIEAALDALDDAGLLDVEGDRYVAHLEDRGVGEALRDTPSRVVERTSGIPARVARPLRLFAD